MRRALLPFLALALSCEDCAPPDPPSPQPPNLELAATARHPAASLMAVGGTGPSDVWLVGAQPVPNGPPLVLRSDGTAWRTVETPTLHDVWWVHSFAGGPTYLTGAGATVMRVDGDTVTRLKTPGFAGETAFGAWGATPDDVWVVGGFAGRDGFAWRTDGVTVRDEPLPLDLPRTVDGEVPALLKVWGRSATDVWLVGGLGTILHWNGTSFRLVPSGTTDTLFTVHGDDDEVVIVGGGARGVVLRGGVDGFVDDTPAGAPLLQGLQKDAQGNTWVAGADGYFAGQASGGDWRVFEPLATDAPYESVHALWSDGDGGLYAVGGDVLGPALDEGVAFATNPPPLFTPAPPPPPVTTCPVAAVDPVPDGSVARRFAEQLLNAIRRDIPDPPKHARNIHHTAAAMWDAWAAYDTTAQGLYTSERVTAVDVDAARDTAIAFAAYRVLVHRYQAAQGAAVTRDCLDSFMAVLGLDPADDRVVGSDPVAVGNRIAAAVIDGCLDDGANERNGYADTTGWTPTNPVMVVDRPGTNVEDPNTWQQMNLALAETQNGIVLESSVQPYIGPHWRGVTPFAAVRDLDSGLYSVPVDFPSVDDEELIDQVVQVIRRTAELDVDDGVTLDIGPGTRGNNPLGEDSGTGHPENPVTGEPYAPNVVLRGDFTRVIAEMWADGPRSETPPGHWLKLAIEASDDMEELGTPLRPYGEGEPVDRLAWDVALFVAISGATHDAAIAAWELKRESLGPRPISLVRYFAQNGQRTDPALPSYSEDGLPLIDGLIELITAESSAPGERHFALRHHVGELAVRAWPGEPGDRQNEVTPVQWMRALDWIPYQRRTFVTPAFPGFISGHSTFSRAAAEAMAAFTGSPYFPGGLGEFVAPRNGYLVFEDGPSADLRLQWATYYDAADQAGQSRLFGGIHIFADDAFGRITGQRVGQSAAARARALWLGTDE